jgi:molybdopterin molybdotransferase
MSAPKPMLPVREALDFLLKAARPVGDTEVVSTLAANGRVLAVAQAATINVPSADNTQMDGYAVRAADCASGDATLTVTQRIPAGQVGQFLAPGNAARIFTGAMIPEGADAVVMQEQCDSSMPGMVTIKHTPSRANGYAAPARTSSPARSSSPRARSCAARKWGWPHPSAWPGCRCGAGCG